MPETSKTALPVRVAAANVVFFQSMFVFADDSDEMYGLLTSSVHRVWVAREGTTHETRMRYSVDPCFTTFPRPEAAGGVGAIMQTLDRDRAALMSARWVGMTDLYNLVDDPGCTDAAVVTQRDMHATLDRAVITAYGWEDLLGALNHGYHDIPKFGRRWTIAPDAQREVERRLLELNLKNAANEAI